MSINDGQSWFTVIRANPEAPNNINGIINCIQIFKSTKKQTEKSTKISLINDLSKRLLELEFKSLNKVEVFKMDRQKNTARLQRMKNKPSKIKPTKTENEIGLTFCSGCKDYAENFKP